MSQGITHLECFAWHFKQYHASPMEVKRTL